MNQENCEEINIVFFISEFHNSDDSFLQIKIEDTATVSVRSSLTNLVNIIPVNFFQCEKFIGISKFLTVETRGIKKDEQYIHPFNILLNYLDKGYSVDFSKKSIRVNKVPSFLGRRSINREIPDLPSWDFLKQASLLEVCDKKIQDLNSQISILDTQILEHSRVMGVDNNKSKRRVSFPDVETGETTSVYLDTEGSKFLLIKTMEEKLASLEKEFLLLCLLRYLGGNLEC